MVMAGAALYGALLAMLPHAHAYEASVKLLSRFGGAVWAAGAGCARGRSCRCIVRPGGACVCRCALVLDTRLDGWMFAVQVGPTRARACSRELSRLRAGGVRHARVGDALLAIVPRVAQSPTSGKVW